MKRTLLLILIFLPMLPLEVKAQFEVFDDILYILDDYTLTARVEECENKEINGNIDIPETVTYKGYVYSVTSIASYAFINCIKLTCINIPNSVTSIGGEAFAGCTGLTSITIPIGVRDIGDHAFPNGPNLTSIEVAEGNSVFDSRENCNAIIQTASNTLIFGCQNSTIPSSVTTIGDYAFGNCTGLISITIPSSVTTIGGYAFDNCTGLTSITIPNSVTSIGNMAFGHCSNLSSVIIGEHLESIKYGAFKYCSSLTSVIIPNSVATIGEEAFRECGNLSSVVIGDGVKNIEKWTFLHCTNLSSVTIGNSVESIKYGAFNDCPNLTTINIPNSVTTIDKEVFQDCSNLSSVIIGNSVASIGEEAFRLCSKLKDFYSYAEQVPECHWSSFSGSNYKHATLHVPAASISTYQSTEPWKNFKEIVALPDQAPQNEYRPFIEEDKVWIVRVSGISPDGSQMEPYIEYCYLDGDTIIGGQTCKRMMCDTNDNPSPYYLGAWYEQDKKVYFSHDGHPFELLYDFTLSSGDNIQDPHGDLLTVIKKSGDITGFKGTYYDIINNDDPVIERWLEGVGSESWPYFNHPHYMRGNAGGVLLACIAGDEVVYYNSEEDDPYTLGARKRRFDFTHTIKTKPQSRTRNGAEDTMYGEYNDQQLCINLNPLDETYLVSITSESGKTVYEKEINAGNIVALNIDISTYAEGRYTVTVENSRESFTGEFGAQTTGIKEISNKKEVVKGNIYNLQGQRLSMPPAKGFYIQNGKKIVVK